MVMKHASLLAAAAIAFIPACASDLKSEPLQGDSSQPASKDQPKNPAPVKQRLECPVFLSAGGYINAMPGPGYDPKNRPTHLTIRLKNAQGWAAGVKRNSRDTGIQVNLFPSRSKIVKPPAKKPKLFGHMKDKYELRFTVRQPKALRITVTCRGQQIGSGTIGVAH